MNIQKRIPSRPRYHEISYLAHQFIIDMDVQCFPVSILEIYDKLSDSIILYKYTELQRIMGIPDPFDMRKKKAEGLTQLDPRLNKYLVIYDDQITTPARINWTLAHELGHIICNHLIDFDQTELHRCGLNKKDYDVLEAEANHCASEILMPSYIVSLIPNISREDIELLFFVSQEAAGNKYQNLFEYHYENKSRLIFEIVRKTYDSIVHFSRIVFSKHFDDNGNVRKNIRSALRKIGIKCTNCGCFIQDNSATFCPNCGMEVDRFVLYHQRPKNIDDYRYRMEGGYELVDCDTFHDVLDLKGNIMHLGFCPVCLNEEITYSTFCDICGSDLRCFCFKCNAPLRRGYRYCPHCGNPTQYKWGIDKIEQRLSQLSERVTGIVEKEELLLYPDWLYLCRFILKDKYQLCSALFYALGCIDDDGKLIIFTDNNSVLKTIRSKESELRLSLQRINFNQDFEIRNINDL